jgi:hypothetical protein
VAIDDEAVDRLKRWSVYLADRHGPYVPEAEQEKALDAWARCEEPPTEHLCIDLVPYRCDPPGACAEHGRCWTHSDWEDA